MKTEKKNLGKVSLTCNGKWDIHKAYERLCLVHDGNFASYISKQGVPADGIELNNEEYWQPVANLKEDVKVDLEGFKEDLLELLAQLQVKLSGARIVVGTMEERDALTADEVAVGCEVYVLETGQSWILDKMVLSTGDIPPVKEWHLEVDSKLDSEERFQLMGFYTIPLTSERAICDGLGNIIHDTYITRKTIHVYVDELIKEFIDNWKYEIKDGTITYDMLSESLKQMLKGKGGNITNLPDEEDLTVVNEQLKFKDREYDDEGFGGRGYKVLRKHFMGEVNLLEQELLDQENTIYELRYLFCLDGNEVTIPEGCTLLFKGGCINNGTLDLNEANVIGVTKLSDMGTAVFENFAKGQVLYIDDGGDEVQGLCVYEDGKWKKITVSE